MNKVILIGRLAADPESREFSSGTKNCTFRLGVQRNFRNSEGNYDSDWISCVAWRQNADYATKYLSKGNRVAVEGSLQTRSFDGQDGQKRYVTEVIVDHIENLTPRKSEGNEASESGAVAPAPASAATYPAPNVNHGSGFTEVPYDEDKLPF